MNGAEILAYPADDPALVTAAARLCVRLATVTTHLAGALRKDAAVLETAWQGAAAQGCRAELAAAARLARSMTTPLQAGVELLRRHAEVLDEARSQVDNLRRAYDDALARNDRAAAMTGAGGLPGPVRAMLAREAHDLTAGELAALRRRHRAVLDEVTDHARLTGRLLTAAAGSVLPAQRDARSASARESVLAAALPLLESSRRAAGVGAGPPPSGTPPELVQQWWAALTSDEKARAVSRWPATVGALDGLPIGVRSRANEARLAADLVGLAARSARGALGEQEQRRLDTCRDVAAAIARVRRTRDPRTSGRLIAQLLIYRPADFEHQGRVAVVVGDAETADHVAVLVPGLESDVPRTIPGLTAKAGLVATEARRLAPLSTTAVVAWMGYDAPGLLTGAGDGAARRGGQQLAADLRGLQAGRGMSPHLSVVGHSYGSTTVGFALREQTGVDDVVLIGSPGAGVEHASALRVPAGHVFVGSASRDPVSYLDRFGGDPAHEEFGATRFRAEGVDRNAHTLDFRDHSTYYQPRSESLGNIVRVVIGAGAEIERAAYRAEDALLPDGIRTDPESVRVPTSTP